MQLVRVDNVIVHTGKGATENAQTRGDIYCLVCLGQCLP